MKRKWIIGIAVSLLLLTAEYYLLASSQNIPPSEFSARAARQDIKEGRVMRIVVGFSVLTSAETDPITKKYGFTVYSLGCVVDGEIDGIKEYNKVVNEWLDK
jgi:hypothetical protein